MAHCLAGFTGPVGSHEVISGLNLSALVGSGQEAASTTDVNAIIMCRVPASQTGSLCGALPPSCSAVALVWLFRRRRLRVLLFTFHAKGELSEIPPICFQVRHKRRFALRSSTGNGLDLCSLSSTRAVIMLQPACVFSS